jgi:glutamate synthase (NADPH/NADH) small chain
MRPLDESAGVPAAEPSREPAPTAPLEAPKPRHRPVKGPRTPMRENDPAERVASFGEVGLGYDAAEAHTEAMRCLQCLKPPCVGGCPVHIDIKSFIGKIIEGDECAGVEVLKARNALPSACGRVCPQEEQCELACVLQRTGQPIAIGRLERYLGDFDLAREPADRCRLPRQARTGKRAAVVGSGPSGLACAGELAMRGHEVVVFESLHVPGGVLVYGIPEFRLPKALVQAEIDMLSEIGVRIVTDAVVGATYTLEDLLGREGFDAIFIGSGAGLPIFSGIPGENLNGVYSSNEFLTRVNLMRAWEFPTADTPVWRGRAVAVVGGGNVAMDAARTALRLGAGKVTLVYRRTEEEMPARHEEVHHARQEGVEFMMLCSPQEVLGRDGFVTAMRVTRMELGEPDASGRRAPACIVGSEFDLECDTVIMALGTRANPLLTKAAPGLALDERGYIAVDADGATSLPGVYAGGDIVTGSATVIRAMGAGKDAARAMDVWLRR